jgi:hypothetical protein
MKRWTGKGHRLPPSRERCANIENPKIVQTILSHPKTLPAKALYPESHPLISTHFGDSVGGSEKAGVSGSIPSLATNP